MRGLAEQVAPGAEMADLGGSLSLNASLNPAGLVLRVHQPFVSKRRILALQALRAELARRGLVVAPAVTHEGAAIFRCGDRWAELEPFIESGQPAPAVDSYAWLFTAIGLLDRHLRSLDLHVPAPLVATFAVPSTLLRWLPITEHAVSADGRSLDALARVRRLVNRLRVRWVSGRHLPLQLIHGDARLGNIRLAPGDEVVYLDFGFAARRPRIHEVAYALVYMVLALDGHMDLASFDWGIVPAMLDAYEDGAREPLSLAERNVLVPYMAAVPLYHAATAGFVPDPAAALRSAMPAVALSEWILANPVGIPTTS